MIKETRRLEVKDLKTLREKWSSRSGILQEHYNCFLNTQRDDLSFKKRLPNYADALALPCMKSLLASGEADETITSSQFTAIKVSILTEAKTYYRDRIKHELARLFLAPNVPDTSLIAHKSRPKDPPNYNLDASTIVISPAEAISRLKSSEVRFKCIITYMWRNMESTNEKVTVYRDEAHEYSRCASQLTYHGVFEHWQTAHPGDHWGTNHWIKLDDGRELWPGGITDMRDLSR